MKYPELKRILDKTNLQLAEDVGRLEATLDLVGMTGLTPKVISMIHNSSRGAYCNLFSNINLGGEVSERTYNKVIGLFERAEKLLGNDIHATYERERIEDLVKLTEKKRPELNRYLARAA